MTQDPVIAPLPTGSRLLHIGLPKTGTTTLQRGAAINRGSLLEQGVLYPGEAFNHRDAAAALMRRPLGWRRRGAVVHDRRVWEDLISEVRRVGSERVFVSHEFICEADDRQAKRFVSQLGAGLQVVVTLRGFADLLTTSWQQFVKSGHIGDLEGWLQAVLVQQSGRTVSTFYRRNDQAAIVQRWAGLVGGENVTVVIADKRRPEFLITVFEDLLGLRHGTMSTRPVGGYAANRGLSGAEVELVRRVNMAIHEQRYDWQRYTSLIRHGMIARMQEERQPGPDEPRLELPAWAGRMALIKSRSYADAIVATGCRVIGDPATLSAPIRTVDRVDEPNELPLDAVLQAVAGVLSAAEGKGPFFDAAADGVERRKATDPLLDRFLSPTETRRVLNAYRATRHLQIRSLAAAAGTKLVERVTGRDLIRDRPRR